MLRTKLFRGFAIIVILFSLLSAFLGIRTMKQHITGEAQQRVRLDLSSAWAVHNSQLHEIETILKLVASKQLVVSAAADGTWDNPELLDRLSRIQANFELDFLNLVSSSGQVTVRTTQPGVIGDHQNSNPIVSKALAGESVSAVALLGQEDLKRESLDLAERAFFELENTLRARRTTREVEKRGMVMIGAIPIMSGNRAVGAVYGGILVNRNHKLIDRICDVVYRNEKHGDQALGTATVFLHDSRIATTVRCANGNRALGTRVSKEVADQVLDNGKPWIGEAFVVNEWYLTAYDPIRDIDGNILGMLYVGILRQPFDDYGRSIVIRYSLLSVFVLFVGLILAFVLANSLAQPIHRLVEASHRASEGDKPTPVAADGACRETEELIRAFNDMTARLSEREERLKALNRSYMETLGFVSHELKGPLSTMMNYVYLLKQKKIGGLGAKQEKAVLAIESGLHRLVEMVRHYLNLSRIENQELSPVPTLVNVDEDIIRPLLEAADVDLKARAMQVANNIPESLALMADINMTREVFENLISNAVKYGREGGAIHLMAGTKGRFVEFRVRNDGEGIDQEQRGQLFAKFARLDQTQVGKPKGTGLGLFITKHIVEAHGGTIDVQSKVGHWIEFVFTLPGREEEGVRTDG